MGDRGGVISKIALVRSKSYDEPYKRFYDTHPAGVFERISLETES